MARSKSPPHREKEYLMFGMSEEEPSLETVADESLRVVKAKSPQRAASKALTRLVSQGEGLGVILIETHQENVQLARPRARRTIHAYTIDWSLKGPQSCRVATPTDPQRKAALSLKKKYLSQRRDSEPDTASEPESTGEYSAAVALLKMRQMNRTRSKSPMSAVDHYDDVNGGTQPS